MCRLIERLLNPRSQDGNTHNGMNNTIGVLLHAACCLLTAQPSTSGTVASPAEPLPSLPKAAVQAAWSLQRLLDVIDLLGGIGRWPEAAAVFWAELVVLAPGDANGQRCASADLAAARASLTALTDSSRATALLAVFSHCLSARPPSRVLPPVPPAPPHHMSTYQGLHQFANKLLQLRRHGGLGTRGACVSEREHT